MLCNLCSKGSGSSGCNRVIVDADADGDAEGDVMDCVPVRLSVFFENSLNFNLFFGIIIIIIVDDDDVDAVAVAAAVVVAVGAIYLRRAPDQVKALFSLQCFFL